MIEEIAYIYSAILDDKICPSCRKWDGKISLNRGDLPFTPNKECTSKNECRCLVISTKEFDDEMERIKSDPDNLLIFG